MATILLPLDRSTFSEQALPHALGRLGPGDELLLLQVLGTAPALIAPESFFTDLDLEGAQDYLDKLARRLQERGVKVRTQLRVGNSRQAIAAVAGEVNASLIVMASHGRGGLARWLLGSVAEGVARLAPCPVWLIRCHPQDENSVRDVSTTRILLPVDCAEGADQALDFVQRAFDPKTVGLMLLCASNLDLVGPSDLYRQILGNTRASLEALTERLRAQGWSVEFSMTPGPPATAILDAAAEWKADLIVMGSHTRTAAERWFLGSVAEKVLRHATCPVAVVRMASAPVPA